MNDDLLNNLIREAAIKTAYDETFSSDILNRYNPNYYNQGQQKFKKMIEMYEESSTKFVVDSVEQTAQNNFDDFKDTELGKFVEKVNEKLKELNKKIKEVYKNFSSTGIGKAVSGFFKAILDASKKGIDSFGKLISKFGSSILALFSLFQGQYIVSSMYDVSTKFLDISSSFKGVNRGMEYASYLGADMTDVNLFRNLPNILVSPSHSKDFAMYASSQYADVEEATARVKTILPKEQWEQNNKTIKKSLSSLKNAVSEAEALSIQYEVLSAGFIETAKSAQVMEAAIKLTKVGFADASETARLLVTTMQAYNLEAGQAADTAAKLQGIVQNGITTIPELTAVFGQLASVANEAGVSIEDLGAAIAVLTQKGMRTPVAATSLQALMGSLLNMTPAAEKALKRYSAQSGVYVDISPAAIKQRGFIETMQEIHKITKGDVQKLSDIFTERTAFRAVVGLLSDGGEKAKSFKKSIGEKSVEFLEDQFDIALDTQRDKIISIINEAKSLITDIGKELAPIFKDLLDTVRALLDTFKSIPEPIKNAATFVIKMQLGFNAILEIVKSILATITTIAGVLVANKLFDIIGGGISMAAGQPSPLVARLKEAASAGNLFKATLQELVNIDSTYSTLVEKLVQQGFKRAEAEQMVNKAMRDRSGILKEQIMNNQVAPFDYSQANYIQELAGAGVQFRGKPIDDDFIEANKNLVNKRDQELRDLKAKRQEFRERKSKITSRIDEINKQISEQYLNPQTGAVNRVENQAEYYKLLRERDKLMSEQIYINPRLSRVESQIKTNIENTKLSRQLDNLPKVDQKINQLIQRINNLKPEDFASQEAYQAKRQGLQRAVEKMSDYKQRVLHQAFGVPDAESKAKGATPTGLNKNLANQLDSVSATPISSGLLLSSAMTLGTALYAGSSIMQVVSSEEKDAGSIANAAISSLMAAGMLGQMLEDHPGIIQGLKNTFLNEESNTGFVPYIGSFLSGIGEFLTDPAGLKPGTYGGVRGAIAGAIRGVNNFAGMGEISKRGFLFTGIGKGLAESTISGSVLSGIAGAAVPVMLVAAAASVWTPVIDMIKGLFGNSSFSRQINYDVDKTISNWKDSQDKLRILAEITERNSEATKENTEAILLWIRKMYGSDRDLAEDIQANIQTKAKDVGLDLSKVTPFSSEEAIQFINKQLGSSNWFTGNYKTALQEMVASGKMTKEEAEIIERYGYVTDPDSFLNRFPFNLFGERQVREGVYKEFMRTAENPNITSLYRALKAAENDPRVLDALRIKLGNILAETADDNVFTRENVAHTAANRFDVAAEAVTKLEQMGDPSNIFNVFPEDIREKIKQRLSSGGRLTSEEQQTIFEQRRKYSQDIDNIKTQVTDQINKLDARIKELIESGENPNSSRMMQLYAARLKSIDLFKRLEELAKQAKKAMDFSDDQISSYAEYFRNVSENAQFGGSYSSFLKARIGEELQGFKEAREKILKDIESGDASGNFMQALKNNIMQEVDVLTEAFEKGTLSLDEVIKKMKELQQVSTSKGVVLSLEEISQIEAKIVELQIRKLESTKRYEELLRQIKKVMDSLPYEKQLSVLKTTLSYMDQIFSISESSRNSLEESIRRLGSVVSDPYSNALSKQYLLDFISFQRDQEQNLFEQTRNEAEIIQNNIDYISSHNQMVSQIESVKTEIESKTLELKSPLLSQEKRKELEKEIELLKEQLKLLDIQKIELEVQNKIRSTSLEIQKEILKVQQNYLKLEQDITKQISNKESLLGFLDNLKNKVSTIINMVSNALSGASQGLGILSQGLSIDFEVSISEQKYKLELEIFDLLQKQNELALERQEIETKIALTKLEAEKKAYEIQLKSLDAAKNKTESDQANIDLYREHVSALSNQINRLKENQQSFSEMRRNQQELANKQRQIMQENKEFEIDFIKSQAQARTLQAPIQSRLEKVGLVSELLSAVQNSISSSANNKISYIQAYRPRNRREEIAQQLAIKRVEQDTDNRQYEIQMKLLNLKKQELDLAVALQEIEMSVAQTKVESELKVLEIKRQQAELSGASKEELEIIDASIEGLRSQLGLFSSAREALSFQRNIRSAAIEIERETTEESYRSSRRIRDFEVEELRSRLAGTVNFSRSRPFTLSGMPIESEIGASSDNFALSVASRLLSESKVPTNFSGRNSSQIPQGYGRSVSNSIRPQTIRSREPSVDVINYSNLKGIVITTNPNVPVIKTMSEEEFYAQGFSQNIRDNMLNKYPRKAVIDIPRITIDGLSSPGVPRAQADNIPTKIELRDTKPENIANKRLEEYLSSINESMKIVALVSEKQYQHIKSNLKPVPDPLAQVAGAIHAINSST